MEYTKEIVRKRIIPSLFYDRDAKEILESVQYYFNENNITLDRIKSDFAGLKEINDTSFWKKIILILSNCYNNVTINQKNLEVLVTEDFSAFIEDLLRIRFDEIFEPEVSNKLGDIKNFQQSLDEAINNDSILLNDEHFMRVYVVKTKEEKGNVEPLTPGKNLYYPLLLVKVDKKEKTISFNGKTKHRSEFIKKINREDGEQPTRIIQEETTTFNNFKLSVGELFYNLKRNNFYIKKIKFDNSLFYFNIGYKDIFSLDEFINPELFLNSPVDFIGIKEIKLVYCKEIKKELKEFNFTLKVEIQSIGSDEFFKINFNLNSRKKGLDSESLQQEIISKLKDFGLDVGKSFNMPISYYFSHLTNNREIDKKGYFEKIILLDKDNILLHDLIDKKVISTNNDSFNFNNAQFTEYLAKALKTLEGKEVKFNKGSFKVIEASKNNKSIILRIKRYSDSRDDKYNTYHTVILPNGSQIKRYAKVLNLVFYDLDLYLILQNILVEDYKAVLEYLHFKVKNYLLYQYGLILEKECNFAYFFLRDYLNNLDSPKLSYDHKEIGNKVEAAINIMLKYLYRNFLPIGGRNNPDGYIFTQNELAFLLDSKQHKALKKGEFAKIAGYLKNYPNSENLPKAKGGFFIISEKKLEKSGLNPEARKEFVNDGIFFISFMSLEFLLDYYEFYKDNKAKLISNLDLKKRFFNLIEEIILDARDLDSKLKLRKLENESLSGFRKEFERCCYIPDQYESL